MLDGKNSSQQVRGQGVVADETLPNNTVVKLENSSFIIYEGTVVGSNLFHSFEKLDLAEGQTITFVHPNRDIQNILIRVTRGSPSKISGTLISSKVPGSNVFLISPDGILFEDYAGLDVSHSFLATTADSLRSNTGVFSASKPESNELFSDSPTELSFDRSAITEIVIHTGISRVVNNIDDKTSVDYIGGLQVPQGKSLLFIGGNIRLEATRINFGKQSNYFLPTLMTRFRKLLRINTKQRVPLKTRSVSTGLLAPNGRIELGGLAEEGIVGLNVDGDKFSLKFVEESALADVIVTSAFVNTTAEGSGSIAVNANNLEISQGSTFTAGIKQGSRATGDRGDIALNTTGIITINSGLISNNVLPNGIGDVGNIDIKTQSLILANDANLSTSTYGQGNSGNILVQSKREVILENPNSGIFSNTYTSGNAGSVQIAAESVTLTGGANLNACTFGDGNANEIVVKATDTVALTSSTSYISVSAGASAQEKLIGNAGRIAIQAKVLALANREQLVVGNSVTERPGEINLDDVGTIIIDDENKSSAAYE